MHYGSEYLRGLGESLDAALAGYRLDFALALERAMDRHNVHNAELARRLETSAAYVTKLLRGDANCTIDTMGRAARALGEEIVIDIRPTASAALASSGGISVDVQSVHAQSRRNLWLAYSAEAPVPSVSSSNQHVRLTAA